MVRFEEFMEKAKKAVSEFEETWEAGIKSDASGHFPEWMEEEDWWEQLAIYIQNQSDYL